MFEKIIGYDYVKNELLKFYDVIKNPQCYKKFGAQLPKGILLYGPSGSGKSLFVDEFVKNSGLKSFYIDRNETEPMIIESVYSEAVANAPSIVVIENMDRTFTAEDQYILQNSMDWNNNVFTIATAYDTVSLMPSLLRAGRFDRIIKMDRLTKNDFTNLVKYSLSTKPISPDIDPELVAKMIGYDEACSSYEPIINMAGLYAGYERSNCITMKHIIDAILSIKYDKPASTYLPTQQEIIESAYHEAGHAAMSELSMPGSMALATIRRKTQEDGCFCFCPVSGPTDIQTYINDIHVGLSGKAAVELGFNKCDIGARADLEAVSRLILKVAQVYGYNGFQYIVPPDIEFRDNAIAPKGEDMLGQWLDQYYTNVKNILTEHWRLVDTIAKELIRKETLISYDIENIKASLGYQI